MLLCLIYYFQWYNIGHNKRWRPIFWEQARTFEINALKQISNGLFLADKMSLIKKLEQLSHNTGIVSEQNDEL